MVYMHAVSHLFYILHVHTILGLGEPIWLLLLKDGKLAARVHQRRGVTCPCLADYRGIAIPHQLWGLFYSISCLVHCLCDFVHAVLPYLQAYIDLEQIKIGERERCILICVLELWGHAQHFTKWRIALSIRKASGLGNWALLWRI